MRVEFYSKIIKMEKTTELAIFFILYHVRRFGMKTSCKTVFCPVLKGDCHEIYLISTLCIDTV
jgi:hypothetical protein